MPDHTLPEAHAAVRFGDLFRYIALIEEIITLSEQAKALPVGGSQAVPPIKFKANGHSYTLEHDQLTRTA